MKNFLKIAIILVLGFVIYSCSKENNTLTPEEEGNDFGSPLGSRGDGCDIVTENTFDYVGQVHNEVIVDYLNQFPEGIDDDNEMFAITGELCMENDKFREHYGSNILPTDTEAIEKIINDSEDDYSYVREMIRQKDVSDLTKEKLLNLIDFMVREAQQEREPNYDVFDSKLANFEREIMNSNDYRPEESELLLSSVSIARHSACLWNGKLAGVYMTGRRPGIGFWGWVEVALSDYEGYAAASNPISGIFQGIRASKKAYKKLKAELAAAETGNGTDGN